MSPILYEKEVRQSLQRILPRIQKSLKDEIGQDPHGWAQFNERLLTHYPHLFSLYYAVYAERYDFFYHLEDLLLSLARAWLARPEDLRVLDAQRESDRDWFQSNKMLGGVCYVDLFAGTLAGVKEKIPYFKELGLTYLHLMPLFKAPEGENDGGYAVSSYRETNPSLGTIDELADLAAALRREGISLVVDLVFNHTSDEHRWAEAAKRGDETCQDFYRIFPDRNMPDQYERNLREIFPEEHSGAFTFFSDICFPMSSRSSMSGSRPSTGSGSMGGAPLDKLSRRTFPEPVEGQDVSEEHTTTGAWVWTTFHSYQWDLNYSNPAVFNRMAEEMLFLANQGVEVLRLDAVAFIWKRLGTNCENLPQAHSLIQAFNAVARIAAPALLFKSEAIVHPDEVAKYIDERECQLSYNPLLMALLWNSLATRKVRLLTQAMQTRFRLQDGTAWVNYVRVHDDIGWTFSDEDAAILGVNGFDHRQFLNEYYRGRFPGSFARGLPFQENPQTGDCRISGTCASLAGLEKALVEEGPQEVEQAIRRILLIHGIILTIGGIPLLYLGDEIGTLNDYNYRDDPAHNRDSRWVHRPKADWKRYAKRKQAKSVEGRVYQGLKTLIDLRRAHAVFSGGETEVFQTGNEHVFGFVHRHKKQQALVLANFSEAPQRIPTETLQGFGFARMSKLHGSTIIKAGEDVVIDGLDLLICA